MPSVQVQRDNIAVGLYLAGQPFGATLDDVLEQALGYDPASASRARYESRFRAAQAAGYEQYAARVPGYFTVSAQPFGAGYVYKAMWYTWLNPNTGQCAAVLVSDTDLEPMRRRRDRDLRTRKRNVRAIRAADNVQQQREAIGRGDVAAVEAIQSRMGEDETLGEILTNQLGLPYAEIGPVLEAIAAGNHYTPIGFSFVQSARRLRRLEDAAAREKQRVTRQLANWITIRSGVPGNARQLALADARTRFSALPAGG